MAVGWSTKVAVLGLGAALAACASTDLGSPCHLLGPNNTEMSPVSGQDIVQTGSGECQQFICASFNGSPPQCSEACQAVGDPCGNGMVCRAAVLNATLLPEAQAQTQGQHLVSKSSDDFQALLGGVTNALYCGPKPSGG